MKLKMNKKNICLTVAALMAVVSLSVGSAMAYFSTYVVSKGTQEIELDFSETKIDEKISPNVKAITVENVGTTECYVRVCVLAGSAHNGKWAVDLTDSSWRAGSDGYYYYNVGGSEKMLTPGEKTSELKINISKFEEFNVIVMQENSPVLYDENGEAYSDWDRSDLNVTDSNGNTINVKRSEEE